MKTRYKRPDKKNALSIIEAAKKDMDFTLSLKITEKAGPTIIRNIYECFRMLGDSILASKGADSVDHVEPIKELLKVKALTSRPIYLIDNLRRLKHNINYYGYSPLLIEVRDAVSIAESCFNPLLTEIVKKLR